MGGNYKCRKAKTRAKAGESCHKLPCCNKGHLVCDKKNYVCVKPKKCGKKGDDCGGKDDLPCCNKFGLKCEDYKCIKPKTRAKKGQSCSDLPCCNGWGLVCDKGNICTKPAKCAKLGQECKYTPCCNNKAGVKCYATTDKCCIEKDYPCKYDSDCCDGHCYDYAKGKARRRRSACPTELADFTVTAGRETNPESGALLPRPLLAPLITRAYAELRANDGAALSPT